MSDNQVQAHAAELQAVIQRTAAQHAATIQRIADRILEALRRGGKAIIMGNGGSYADSFHFAAELEGAYRNRNRRALAAVVPSNPASITAIGNDFGYQEVFRKFVEAFGRPEDVVIGLSTSGNSDNVVRAFVEARRIGATVVAFTGESGGKMKEHADILLAIPSRDTARIQEAQHFAYHEICEIVENTLFAEDGSPK